MAFDGYGGVPATALTRQRIVYVNSATGNDNTGQGTQSSPWATLRRAWIERMQYLELRAPFVVQLQGVGPYVMDFPIGASQCSPEGRFIVIGDPLAGVNILQSGTATGDMVNFVIPTSAIVGLHPYSWVRFTSGNCSGCMFQLQENGANSITVANNSGRTTNGAIANGDAWQLVEPVTQIQIVGAAPGPEVNPGSINNWTGTFSGTGTLTIQACHWFYGIRFTGPGVLRTQSGSVGLGFCRVESSAVHQNVQLQCGMLAEQTGIPGAESNRLFGAGAIFNAGCNYVSADVTGVISSSSTSSYGGQTRFVWAGGRIGNPVVNSVFISGMTTFENFSATSAQQLLLATIDVQGPGPVLRASGTWRSSVTLGSCIRPTRGALVIVDATWTGGTTDAAGYGVDVRSGGRCLFRNQTPQLTGGTAGSDLRTTNVPVAAVAALNANGNAVGNATDALLGEVLARVA